VGLLLIPMAVYAQGPARLAADLEKLLTPAGIKTGGTSTRRPASLAPAGSEEVLVRWSGTSATRAPQPSLDVVSRRKLSSRVRRLRSLDLHPDQWMYVAVDRESNLVSWDTVPDPRLLRAEQPGPDGVLTGQRVMRDQAEVLFSIADDPTVSRIRVFQPQRRGDSFELIAIGEVNLEP
jgi:hypothetical protein